MIRQSFRHLLKKISFYPKSTSSKNFPHYVYRLKNSVHLTAADDYIYLCVKLSPVEMMNVIVYIKILLLENGLIQQWYLGSDEGIFSAFFGDFFDAYYFVDQYQSFNFHPYTAIDFNDLERYPLKRQASKFLWNHHLTDEKILTFFRELPCEVWKMTDPESIFKKEENDVR